MKTQDAVAVGREILNVNVTARDPSEQHLADIAEGLLIHRAATIIEAHTENAVAARVQPLVDALNEIASMGYTGCPDIHMRCIARDALAAYKESE